MAYLPTPDSSGQCCGCQRANPCDTCTPEGACCYGPDCFDAYSQYDCESSGGQYMGDNSSCGGATCPTGACCFGCTCYENYNANGCGQAGGMYRGDGSICTPNPCQPPTVSLLCDSISASKSKCGFETVDCDGVTKEIQDCYVAFDPSSKKWWLTKNHINTPTSDCPPSENCIVIATGNCVNPAWPCVSNFFSGSRTQDYIIDETIDPVTCVANSPTTESITINTYCRCQDPTPIYSGDELCPDPATITDRCPAACQSVSPPYVSDCTTVTTTFSYSNEYTTDQLKSNAVAALHSYSGQYTGGACCGSRYLATDETSYSIQRTKYKFQFGSSTGDFRVDWVERFTPANGDPHSDTPMSAYFSAGTIESSVYDLNEPSTNGTVCAVDVTVTCA